MAFPTAAIPYIISGAGSIANMFGGGKGAKSYRRGVLTRIDTQKENLLAGSPYEDLLAQIATGQNPMTNLGSDALMQLLRLNMGERNDVAQRTLEEQATTGVPFDTSALFGALDPLEQRAQQEALSRLRGTSGSLGQRFGSAMGQQQGNLLAQMVESASARRAQIQQAAFEAAQARRMGAAGTLAQRRQWGDQNVLDAINAIYAQQAQRLAGTQAASQAWLGRQGLLTQLMGVLGGVPAPGANNAVGEGLQDIGGLAMLYQLMSQRNKRGSAGAALPV